MEKNVLYSLGGVAVVKLPQGSTGYELVEMYIKRYWEHNNEGTVIFRIGLSYDNKKYRYVNDVAIPIDSSFDNVEFVNDWWEGERYIELMGIVSVDKLNILGGIYEQ